MLYEVSRSYNQPETNAVWKNSFWREIESLQLQNVLKKASDHLPKTEAKVTYDDEAIYVIFRVEDRYVRAVAKGYGGDVWKDSAVEFFFTPGPVISKGYFNLEMNCGGTALFHYQTIPLTDRISIDPGDFAEVQIAHTMPKIIEPEIKEPTTWLIEYRLPFSVIVKYSTDFTKPGPGVKWCAIFYKIANDSSHPHWLIWSYIERTKLGFHNPGFFGTLIFS